MPALLFGSISTVADTSELQRHAFNRAFEEHGLGWHWDRDAYLELLQESGGRQRIAAFAAAQGQQVDAAAVHDTKSRLFQESLAGAALEPRPGVVEAIQGAKAGSVKVALVTTTSAENVTALLAALEPSLHAADFDVRVDLTDVDRPKPDGAAYVYALGQLGEAAAGCVAIEDNLDGVRAATAAGLPCIAFPNANTAGHAFVGARSTVDHLSFDDLSKEYLTA